MQVILINKTCLGSWIEREQIIKMGSGFAHIVALENWNLHVGGVSNGWTWWLAGFSEAVPVWISLEKYKIKTHK